MQRQLPNPRFRRLLHPPRPKSVSIQLVIGALIIVGALYLICHHAVWKPSHGGITKLGSKEYQKIMSAITEFAARQSAALDQIKKNNDAVLAQVADLQKQVADLKTQSATLSPEDQATLDAVDAKAQALIGSSTPPAP